MNNKHQKKFPKPTVLIVDDQPANIQVLSNLLRDNYIVLVAPDGFKALEIVHSKTLPDVILLDIIMPDMDGYEVCRRLKADAQTRDIPVIFVTAKDQDTEEELGFSLGAVDYIVKPFNPHIVRARVRNQVDLKLHTDMLKQAAMERRILLDNIHTQVWYLTDEQTYGAVNKAHAEFVGLKPEDLAFKDMHDVFPQKVVEACRANNKQVFSTGRPVHTEEWAQKASGEQRMLSILKSPIIREDGSVEYVVCSAEDITERKHLEQLREEVERITRHDMKTPLNSIIAIPDLLLESASLDDESRELVHYIKKSGHTLLNMINLSLDLYKMEQGTYQLDPGTVDLVRVLRQILRQLEPISRAKKIRVRLMHQFMDVPEDFTFLICGEEMLCYLMFSNLIKNALEASPEGKDISIQMQHQDFESFVTIHNHGEVPRAIRDVFFDKFTTYGKKSGTGLGTYSAALIARTQNGGIDMQTSQKSGTKLTVRLPLCG